MRSSGVYDPCARLICPNECQLIFVPVEAVDEADLFTLSPLTSQRGEMTNTQHIQTIQPPEPPRDLIASALHLPLSKIDESHRGRKVRTIGQYVFSLTHFRSFRLMNLPLTSITRFIVTHVG